MSDVRRDPLEALGLGLPLTLIVSLLPLDTRLRCRELSRAWRKFLGNAINWRVLDMRKMLLTAAENRKKKAANALVAACARAKGTAEALLLDKPGYKALVRAHNASAIVRAACASLTRVEVHHNKLSMVDLEELLRLISPNVRSITISSVQCQLPVSQVLPLLRREARFKNVEVTHLGIRINDPESYGDDAGASELAAAAAAHTALSSLELAFDTEPRSNVMDHLFDTAAAVGPRLRCFKLFYSGKNTGWTTIDPSDLVKRLARLLPKVPTLPELRITSDRCLPLPDEDDDEAFLNGPVLPSLFDTALSDICAALRASRLRLLCLKGLFIFDTPGGAALISALTCHPTLCSIKMGDCGPYPFDPIQWDDGPPVDRSVTKFERRVAVGEALRVLVSMPSALTRLELSFCVPKEAILPLFAGVERSIALQVLHCGVANDAVGATHEAILASVRRNTSLRKLNLFTGTRDAAAPLKAAEALVRDRVNSLHAA